MWSPQQEIALTKVSNWLQSKNKPYFMLGGYAGTGKTTLAKELVQSVQGRVYFAAYTGKAAHVLKQSGISNVSTVHSLIYQPKVKSEKKLKALELERASLLKQHPPVPNLILKINQAIDAENKNLDSPLFSLNTDSELKNASLLVIDEYSMISEQIGEDLLSFRVPILALGDPAQLPPVFGESFFKGEPDYMLTEIHRQAKDNPIIMMAASVRKGTGLHLGQFGTSRVVDYREVGRDGLKNMILSTDQLLVGRNKTRHASNKRIRELKGYLGDVPVRGDKVVCLRNDHDQNLLNGQLWTVEEDGIQLGENIDLVLKDDDGNQTAVECLPHFFRGQEPDMWEAKEAASFGWGYALTVHKAQGSQWGNVVLFDEWFSRHRRKWLYTAITRASDSITVVQGF